LDRNLVKAQTESYVVKLKEAGMTITTPNLKEFAKATDGVMDAFATIYGADLIAKMRAATK
jgi:TRAP-type C4-dicarboxylate transport system substrate-binding protein